MRIHSTPLLLSTLLLATSCSKDEDPAPIPSPGGGGGTTALTSATPTSMQFTLDGSTISIPTGGNYVEYHTSSTSNTTPPAFSNGAYNSVLGRISNLEPVFSCWLGRYQYYYSAPDSVFFNFFPISSVAFGDPQSSDLPTALGKVSLSWWDSNGNEWGTRYGSNQTGSAFAITQRLLQPSQQTYSSVKIRVTFSAKLYNANGSGAFKTLTNGSAVLTFKNLN